MKKILDNPYLTLVVRVVLGAIFVFWSIGKIADPGEFAREILNYRILPDFIVNIFALILPWLELICGIMLIAGIKIRANAAVIGFMLVVFIIAISSAMIRGFSINCGCSTANPEEVGWPKLFEDFGMLVAAVWLIIFPNNTLSFEKFLVKESLKESQTNI